jgi:hypothetical protein
MPLYSIVFAFGHRIPAHSAPELRPDRLRTGARAGLRDRRRGCSRSKVYLSAFRSRARNSTT